MKVRIEMEIPEFMWDTPGLLDSLDDLKYMVEGSNLSLTKLED